ncbi:hypothetical protein [Streptomyces sp. NPDC002851]
MSRNYSRALMKRLFGTADRCAYPGCAQRVTDTTTSGDVLVLVEVAHIRAHSGGGPRPDPSYPARLRDSHENLLLLCHPHHAEVDRDPATYAVPLLEEWQAEQRKQRTERTDGELALIEAFMHRQELRSGLARVRDVVARIERALEEAFEQDNTTELNDRRAEFVASVSAYLDIAPDAIRGTVRDLGNGMIGWMDRVRDNTAPRKRAWMRLQVLSHRPDTRACAEPATAACHALVAQAYRAKAGGGHRDQQFLECQKAAEEALYSCMARCGELTVQDVETLINDASEGAPELGNDPVARRFRDTVRQLNAQAQQDFSQFDAAQKAQKVASAGSDAEWAPSSLGHSSE